MPLQLSDSEKTLLTRCLVKEQTTKLNATGMAGTARRQTGGFCRVGQGGTRFSKWVDDRLKSLGFAW